MRMQCVMSSFKIWPLRVNPIKPFLFPAHISNRLYRKFDPRFFAVRNQKVMSHAYKDQRIVITCIHVPSGREELPSSHIFAAEYMRFPTSRCTQADEQRTYDLVLLKERLNFALGYCATARSTRRWNVARANEIQC